MFLVSIIAIMSKVFDIIVKTSFDSKDVEGNKTFYQENMHLNRIGIEIY